MQGASDLDAALESVLLTDRRQARMQFLLTDLALAFAALLGYRALEVAVRRGALVVLLARRAARQLRAPRQFEDRKPPLPRSDPSQSPRHRDVPRAPWHGLINLW
jgi:hypothetical protein